MSATASTAALPPMPLGPARNFPDHVPPVLVKELRQGLHSRGFAAPFLTIHILLAVGFAFAFLTGDEAGGRGQVNSYFWLAATLPLLLIAPLRALGTIRQEVTTQSLDLLQLTPLTAARIVGAKWFSLFLQALLYLVSLLPLFVLRYFFGGVDLAGDLVFLGWIVSGCALGIALGIALSTLPRAVMFVVVGLFATGGGPTLIGLTYAIGMGGGGRFLRLGDGGAATLAIVMPVAAIIGIQLLLFAASRIAPPSDSLGARLRLSPLLCAIPLGLTLLLPADLQEAARVAIILGACIAGAIIAGRELSSAARPLQVHHARLRSLPRPLAATLLPGWPSAALYAVAVAILSIAALVLAARMGTADAGTQVGIAVGCLSALAAVLAPRVAGIVAFRSVQDNGWLHLVLHAAGGLLALIYGSVIAMDVFGSRSSGAPLALAWFPTAFFFAGLAALDDAQDRLLIGAVSAGTLAVFAIILIRAARARTRQLLSKPPPAAG